MTTKKTLLAGAGVAALMACAIALPAKAADDTVVSGRMYYNISNISQESNGVEVNPSGTGIDVKRFYIGVDHKFGDMFSGNVTTDFSYVANDSVTQLYIKKAYLQAKVNDSLTLRLGAADLPWVPYAEGIYGFRHIENTVADRTKFGTSSDWGVHAFGNLGENVSYAVAVLNGNGYKNPTRSQSVDIEGRLSAKFDKINVAIGGYTGKLGKNTVGAVTPNTATRFNVLAAYVDPQFTLGVEYFTADNWNNVTTVAQDSANGYALFGSLKVSDKSKVFARYDHVEPKKDLSPLLEDDYFNVGWQYSPYKNVDFALVYKKDEVKNGSISTSNGTIGGAVDGSYDEFGVWGQFRF